MESLARMFGLPAQALGHLTSSGTIANLEALWIARELHPGTAVVHSEGAHYTHARMCQVLGVESRAVPAGPDGRIDLDAVAAEVARGGVGTLVLTPGSTGLGAVDDIRAALAFEERHGVRLHVDGAYGGFYALLAGGTTPTRAIGACDSVVVDPHKHGLQPYGCGAVLFADPGVGRFYKHDSPYTYFTSDELHLGEISLECSRAGAAAGALWLTLQAFPLERDRGLGPILAACRRAALALADRLRGSTALHLHVEPGARHRHLLAAAAAHERDRRRRRRDAARRHGRGRRPGLPVDAADRAPARFAALHPEVERDADSVRVLRSVLMKPEHEASARPAARPARGARRGRTALAAAPGGLEDLLAVAGVGGVEGDAGADDLVDAVEDRGVERDVGGGQLALELLHRARADDRGGHGGVVDDEGDGQLDQRHARVVGHLRELLDRLELALVLRQRHVEARGEALARGRGRRAVGAPVPGQPAAAERAVGEDAHAVALRGRQDVELDAAHEQRVRRLLGAEALQAPLARGPLRLDDLPAENEEEPM